MRNNKPLGRLSGGIFTCPIRKAKHDIKEGLIAEQVTNNEGLWAKILELFSGESNFESRAMFEQKKQRKRRGFRVVAANTHVKLNVKRSERAHGRA